MVEKEFAVEYFVLKKWFEDSICTGFNFDEGTLYVHLTMPETEKQHLDLKQNINKYEPFIKKTGGVTIGDAPWMSIITLVIDLEDLIKEKAHLFIDMSTR